MEWPHSKIWNRLVAFLTGLVVIISGVQSLMETAYKARYPFFIGLFVLVSYWLFHVFFSRESPEIEGGKGVFRYPRARPWAIVGFAILVLTALSFGVSFLIDLSRPHSGTRILVATFDGPDNERLRVTDAIISALRRAFTGSDHVDIQVESVPISESQGKEFARRKGSAENADIVIWGWYGVSPKALLVTAHVEVLKQKEWLSLNPWIDGNESRTVEIEDVNSFKFQLNLSREIEVLSYVVLGLRCYGGSQWKQAISFLDRAIETSKAFQTKENIHQLVYFRGNAKIQLSDWDGAVRDYTWIIDLLPDHAWAYHNRAVAYLFLKRADLALADLTEAIRTHTTTIGRATSLANRAVVRASAGDFEGAQVDLQECQRIRPALPWLAEMRATVLFSLGTRHFLEGRLNEAVVSFDEVIAARPNSAAAYVNRGMARAQLKDPQGAIADFSYALKLRPELGDALHGRALAYWSIGQKGAAFADFDLCAGLKPLDGKLFNDRGIARMENGDITGAIQDYTKALSCGGSPQHLARRLSNRGYALQTQGDLEAAVNDYTAAIQMWPGTASALFGRATVYRRLGRFPEAIKDLKAIVNMQSDDPNLPGLLLDATRQLTELRKLDNHPR